MTIERYDLPSLGSGIREKTDVAVEYKSGGSFHGTVHNCMRVGFGVFVWPGGARYEGEFCDDRRSGKGRQEWPDGSCYSGEFVSDVRHGEGKHQWANGETYEGNFFKDRRHGNGVYTWPNGSFFAGLFFMDKKEGYGTYTFSNGDVFTGLYKDDEREGPGVITYTGSDAGSQDVGLWHGEKLIKFISPAEAVAALTASQLSGDDVAPPELFVDMTEVSNREAVTLEHLTPAPEVDYHGSDVNKADVFHETLASGSQAADDTAFTGEYFGRLRELSAKSRDTIRSRASMTSAAEKNPEVASRKSSAAGSRKSSAGASRKSSAQASRASKKRKASKMYVTDSSGKVKAWNMTPRLIDIQRHMYKHRDAEEALTFDLESLIKCKRTSFEPAGCLEQASDTLIAAAATGDVATVERLLVAGRVHVDVTDSLGNTPLLAAAANWHMEVINSLLDNGANVNKLNDEGMAALSACVLQYYPAEAFLYNIAERDMEPPVTEESQQESLRGSKSDMGGKRRNTKRLSDGVASDLKTSVHGTGSRKISGAGEGAEEEEEDADEDAASISEFYSHRSIKNLSIEVTERLRERGATQLSFNDAVVTTYPEGQGDVRIRAYQKNKHERQKATIDLLLQRGADPNASSVPMPVLFFALKSGDADMVEAFLASGARTDSPLGGKKAGLQPLHIASAIPGASGVNMVRLLLDALGHPDARAEADDSYLHPATEEEWGKDVLTVQQKELLGGRTALHIACARDDNYKHACQVVKLLLQHHANPNLLCNGHSPLSLAIASGNDMAAEELLAYGADPSLPLSHGVGSALCVASSTQHEYRRTPQARLALIDKLMKSGANILAPILIGPKRITGSAVDYAYHMFNQDRRIAHMPYHALTPDERDTYGARRDMLTHLGHLYRDQAVDAETQRRVVEDNAGRSPSPHFIYTGTGAPLPPEVAKRRALRSGQQQVSFLGDGTDGATGEAKTDGGGAEEDVNTSPGTGNVKVVTSAEAVRLTASRKKRQREMAVRKPLVKYCYECGRQVGVRLSPCSRCREVYYCSKACKLKAWNTIHKDECIRLDKRRGRSGSPSPGRKASPTPATDGNKGRGKATVSGINADLARRGMLKNIVPVKGRGMSDASALRDGMSMPAKGAGPIAGRYAKTMAGKHPTATDNYSFE